MKKSIAILMMFLLVFSAIGCGLTDDGELYIRSRKAGGVGKIENVVDVSIADRSVEVSGETYVTLKIGMGVDCNRAAYKGTSMYLAVEADGCIIEGTEDLFKKEYADYYENDIYLADVEDHFWGYPDITPTHFESFDILFPSTPCSGVISVKLVNPEHDNGNHTAELKLYYASNGEVLWLADEVIQKIDDSGRPVYAND